MICTGLFFVYGGDFPGPVFICKTNELMAPVMNSTFRDHNCYNIPIQVSPCMILLESHTTHTYFQRLLGWSAFAGYAILIAGWPLNSFIMKRSIKIQKAVSVARDKRMQVVTELVGAVSAPFMCWINEVLLLIGWPATDQIY